MANATDTKFLNAIDVEWRKQNKAELQPAANLLKDLFSRKSYKEKAFTMKRFGRVKHSDYNLEGDYAAAQTDRSGGTAVTKSQLRHTTPDGQVVDWNRRESKSMVRAIKIDSNRITAKALGTSVKELARVGVQAYRADKARMDCYMMLKFFTETFIENNAVLGFGRHTERPFPVEQNFFALDSAKDTFGTGKTNRNAPLTIDSFFEICARLDDAIGQNTFGQGRMDGSLDSVRRIAIFDNYGWAAFTAQNAAILGNRETFGKPIYIRGYGEYRELHDTLIIVLHSDFMPRFGSAELTALDGTSSNPKSLGFSLGYPKATGAGSLGIQHTDIPPMENLVPGKLRINTGNQGANQSTFLNPTNFFPVYIIYPDAMHFATPEQMDVMPINYREQTESLEWSMYGQTALDGMRFYDEPVFRLWFSGKRVNFADGST